MLTSFARRLKSVAFNRVVFSQLLFCNFCKGINRPKSQMLYGSMEVLRSEIVTHTYPGFTVRVIPVLTDNYMYLLIDDTTKSAALIDPVDPESILREVKKENVTVDSILTTHHHYDHAGGNDIVVKQLKDGQVRVFGGDKRIPSITTVIEDDFEFLVGQLNIKGICTPGHTSNHICYYVTAPNTNENVDVVFTGDTLFLAGCGRFFEGTAAQMNESLNTKLASLPNNTKIYCGHEYTVTNLKFALTVESDNEDVKRALQSAIALRHEKTPTVPSTIGEEKKVNPFMRVHLEKVQAYARKNDPVSTMQVLRDHKNVFRDT